MTTSLHSPTDALDAAAGAALRAPLRNARGRLAGADGAGATRFVYCARGIPIAQSDVTFGELASPAQVRAAARFARLVDAVPLVTPVWSPTPIHLWDVYRTILEEARFAPRAGERAATFHRLHALLDAERRTDREGRPFFVTECDAAAAFDVAPDAAAWAPFATRARLDSGARGIVTGALLTAPLVRPWFEPSILAGHGWHLPPGMPPVSDGAPIPSGLLPMYATNVILARGVTFTLDQDQPADALTGGGDESFTVAPFVFPSPVVTATAVISRGAQIAGFVCRLVPRCPEAAGSA